MLKELLLSAAVALAPAGPALAQAAGGASPQSQDGAAPSAGERATGQGQGQAGAGEAAQGSVKPQVEGSSGEANTGGITKTAKEALPEPSQSGADAAASQTQAPAATAAPLGTAAGRAAVSPETMREIREMALQAERNAPKPAPKSQEAIAADNKAIEAHRQQFFAR